MGKREEIQISRPNPQIFSRSNRMRNFPLFKIKPQGRTREKCRLSGERMRQGERNGEKKRKGEYIKKIEERKKREREREREEEE